MGVAHLHSLLRSALAESGDDLADLDGVVVLSGDIGTDTSWRDYLAAGDSVSDADAMARIDAIQADDLADIMFTSGTTGHPKGAMSTHAQNLRVYEVWSEVVGLREGDRYLIVNPFFHGFGYKAGWFASILRGATIVPMAVFDVPAVMAKVQEERITFLPGPPTLLDRASDDVEDRRTGNQQQHQGCAEEQPEGTAQQQDRQHDIARSVSMAALRGEGTNASTYSNR